MFFEFYSDIEKFTMFWVCKINASANQRARMCASAPSIKHSFIFNKTNKFVVQNMIGNICLLFLTVLRYFYGALARQKTKLCFRYTLVYNSTRGRLMYYIICIYYLTSFAAPRSKYFPVFILILLCVYLGFILHLIITGQWHSYIQDTRFQPSH